MTKVRQSNVELLRIIAMFLVLIVHANFTSISCPNINDVETAPISSFLRILTQSLSLICVNLFVLISGYFGINPKAKSIFNLIFQVVFFRIIAILVVIGLGLSQLSRGLFINIIPGSGDWFVMSYLLLILFSPLINSFIKNTTAKQLLTYIFIFYIIQTLFGWILPIWRSVYYNGYSFISMIGLYLLGRYLNLYKSKLQQISAKYLIGTYFLISIFTTSILFCTIKTFDNFLLLDYAKTVFGSYLSPLVILSSVCLFLFVLKFDFRSKIVNWIAASVFAVYLIHCNPYLFTYYLDFCSSLFEQYNSIQYFFLITLFILSVFITAIIIDKIRIMTWNAIVKIIHYKIPNF